MRLYWEIARRGYRRYAAYPGATAAGVFTNTVFGFMRAYVLLALYRHSDVIGGYDAADAVTYVWLGQAMIMTIYIWGWFDLALRIRTGDIATDLTRPVDPQAYGLAFDLGRAVYHALYRGIPPFVVGALVFELTTPSSPLVWLAFLVSVGLAVCAAFGFRFLYNTAAFWLLDYRGVGVIAALLATLFAGFLVPLSYFPGWLEQVAYALPFAAMLQIPIDVFVGRTDGVEIVQALAFQAGWTAALLLAGRAAFAAGTRKLVVQGG